jgi:hypothetical protein
MKSPDFSKADPVKWAKNTLRHKRERARNGFSFYDWVNFDEYLAWVIVGGLKMFRHHGSGHPSQLTLEQWNDILDEMIEGFEAYLFICSIDAVNEGEEGLNKKKETSDRALQLFVEYFPDLWD